MAPVSVDHEWPTKSCASDESGILCLKSHSHVFILLETAVMAAIIRHSKCDMIKGNELDVGNIDFELQAERGDKFLCFTLFLKLKNCSYLWNQMSD